MSKHFFDYDDGDFAYTVSDNMAIDSDGNMMMRMGDNMAIDSDGNMMMRMGDNSRKVLIPCGYQSTTL